MLGENHHHTDNATLNNHLKATSEASTLRPVNPRQPHAALPASPTHPADQRELVRPPPICPEFSSHLQTLKYATSEHLHSLGFHKVTRLHEHTSTRLHEHTLTRLHEHTLTRAHAYTSTRLPLTYTGRTVRTVYLSNPLLLFISQSPAANPQISKISPHLPAPLRNAFLNPPPPHPPPRLALRHTPASHQ